MSSNTGSVLFLGDFVNPQQQLWASAYNENGGAANLQVSSLTVNPFPTGNILLQSLSNGGVEYNTPLLFQRPSGDINAPSEGLVMNTSLSVPTYPVNGEFITAVKSAGTAYDDIAVKGLQIYGNQTTSGNAGARGYITGDATGVSINSPSLTTSSINVSSIFVGTVVSTTTGTAQSYTASIFMSTPVLFTNTLNAKNAISTNGINNLTGDIVCAQGNVTAIGNNSRMIIGPGAPYPTVTINPSTISSTSITTGVIQTGRAIVSFNLRANGLSSLTVSTSRIAADLATFSTISVRNLSTTFVSSINILTDFINVSRIAQIENMRVDADSFFYGNVTGNEPEKTLLWNGPIVTASSITSPAYYLSNPSAAPAFISTNNNLPYGMAVYSDAFTIKSPTVPTYAGLTTSTSNIVTENLIELENFVSPAISTVNISTNNLFAGQTYATTANASINNSILANISSAVISTIEIGNFSANSIDTDTLSSLTSQVNISLISTLQLKADVGISPNINLGLGDVIQGLIGGASAQGLAVGIGGVGLATGATALVTGRQSGGVNNTVFQTVNGSTQLQFSTIGAPTTSVFLNTDSADPLHAPGNLTQISQLVPAGTYCVRSVGDPLNIDSATEGIQMFGQWVPVVQPTATIARVAISTLTASTINSATATISSLTVSSLNLNQTNTPSTLFASTITYTGSVIGTNPTAPMRWPGPAFLNSTLTNQTQFTNSAGVVTGRIFGTSDFNQGINMIAPNGFTVQNGTNATARFGLDGTTNVFSTLTVEDIQCFNTGYFSTIVVSTFQAVVTPVFPSTMFFSSMNLTGNLTGPNPNGTLSWNGPGEFATQLATKDFGFINAFKTVVSVLRTNTDNNLIWNYPNITMLSGPPATSVSSMVFNANGTINMLSTLRVRDISLSNTLRFGPASTGNPYISTNTDPAQETFFYGGSTMTLQADNTMRLQLGPFNPFVFNNYDSPSPGCSVNINASPMTFTGDPTIGTFNFATFNIPTRFNQSTIMRGPYNGVSTMAISTFTNNNFASQSAVISSLTISSINTPGNVPVGIPTGGVMIWAGGNAFAPNVPVGWLLCDGSQYPQTTYPALYAAIGTTYETTTPSFAGNFFVPDLRFTFPMSPPSYTTPPTAMVNPPSATAYSLATNLGYPGVVANQIWRIVGLKNGLLVPGMNFAGLGPSASAAFIDKMIDGNGDVGTYIMGSLSPGAWPVLGSVGSPVIVTPISIGTGANYPYKIGTYNASGYNSNPNPATTQIYKWGQNITRSNVGVAGATPNTFGGVTSSYPTPTAAGNLSFQTAPNFINMFYIIKY
jgi:hypothetical protein